jgi:hypothetical protein
MPSTETLTASPYSSFMVFPVRIFAGNCFPGNRSRLSAFNVRFLAFMIRRNPARYINTMKLKVHEVDRKIVVRPEIQAMLTPDFIEALRADAQGMVDDMAANHGRS